MHQRPFVVTLLALQTACVTSAPEETASISSSVEETAEEVAVVTDGEPPKPVLPACRVTRVGPPPAVESPVAAVGGGLVHTHVVDAISTRIAALCPMVARDKPPVLADTVECEFETKVETPKAGDVKAVIWDYNYKGDQGQQFWSETKWVDQDGKVLGTEVDNTLWPEPGDGYRGMYSCSMGCTGTLSSTLATGVPRNALSRGLLPPPALQWCDAFQKEMLLRGADCDLGNTGTTWSADLDRLPVPWKKTDEIREGAFESTWGLDKYPGAVKRLVRYKVYVWVIEGGMEALQAKCEGLRQAKTQTELDEICGSKAPKQTYRAWIANNSCHPGNGGVVAPRPGG